MKSKVLLAIIAVIVAAGAGILVLKGSTGPRLAKEGTSMDAQVAEKIVDEVSSLVSGVLPGDEALKTLSADTLFVAQITPPNFQAGVDRVKAYLDRFKATAAYKKLDQDGKISKQFDELLQKRIEEAQPPPESAASPEKPFDHYRKSAEIFYSLWSALAHVNIVVSSKTFNMISAGSAVPFPLILLDAGFVDAANAEKGYDDAAKAILKGQPRLESQFVIAEPRAGARALDMTFKNKDGSIAGKGALMLDGKRLRYVLGDSGIQQFFSDDSARQLFSSAGFLSVLSPNPERAAVLTYGAPAALMKTLDVMFKAIPENDAEIKKNTETMNAALAPYREIEHFGMSFNFDEELTSRACADPVDGSTLDLTYTKIAEARATLPPAPQLFQKLIQPETIIAGRVKLDTVRVMLENMQSQITKWLGTSGSVADDKDVEKVFSKLSEVLDRLGLREAGFLVGPPIMPPIFGVGVFFGSSRLSGEELLNAFTNSVNELASVITSSAKTPANLNAVVAKNSDGKPQIQLSVGGTKIVGGLAGENSLVLSIDTSLVEAFSQRVASGTSYLEGFSNANLKRFLADADYFFFLNTQTLIDLSKGFIPMLLAQQTQEPRLEQKDLEEVAELLKIKYLSAQLTSQNASKSTCSESHMFFLGS